MSSTQPQVNTEKLKTKPGALGELLRTHYSVFVHLDSRKAGVIVPPNFRQPQLCLLLGLNIKPIPIPDLKIDKQGFSATLSFGQKASFVFVPWNAVFAIVGDSGLGNLWQKDVPPDAEAPQREAVLPKGEVAVHRDPEKHITLPPGWRVIDGDKK